VRRIVPGLRTVIFFIDVTSSWSRGRDTTQPARALWGASASHRPPMSVREAQPEPRQHLNLFPTVVWHGVRDGGWIAPSSVIAGRAVNR
jgi:hypothetical protein